jgi:Cd2+/Zn2+-exporting ATPase
MIGRFARQGSFGKLFNLKEFYLTLIGGVLILASFILGKAQPGSPWPAALALTAAAILGGPIIWEALKGLWARQSNVDELVSLAIIASVAVGEYLPAAVVAFIMILGATLEKLTSQHARTAIQSLIRMRPTVCTVLRDEIEIGVPLSEVRLGDLVLIRPGEQAPVDGTVVRGNAAMNQASLTGESLPVEKGAGDPVYAGTASYSGMLVVRAERLGKDTTLGKLIRLVQDAEQARAPILRTADRYARYFTPLIIGISAIVYLATGDIFRAITILIVGCPCAFILAAPTAVTASLGSAARTGVLIKSGAILEELGRIDAVMFDKTGTLTTAEPEVSDIFAADGASRQYVLKMAAAAERYSEHPLARAILEECRAAGCFMFEAGDFRLVPGRGITATVNGKKVFVGAAELPQRFCAQDAGAKTCLVVEEDDRPIGYITISDIVRPEAEGIASQLEGSGIRKVALLTGDGLPAAACAAEISGIREYRHGLLPEEKLNFIRGLQQQGFKVAMVGDGINDAPALAAADIGLAMGTMGTDVAIESSDVALMTDDLTKIPYVLALGRAALNTINFNIIFAALFNLLAIAASGLGYLTPIAGAVVHNLGSVLVVLNSARLINRRPAKHIIKNPVPVERKPATSPGSGDRAGTPA